MKSNIPVTCLGCRYLRRLADLGPERAVGFICEDTQGQQTLGIGITQPRPPDGRRCYRPRHFAGPGPDPVERLIAQFYLCGEILVGPQAVLRIEKLETARFLLDKLEAARESGWEAIRWWKGNGHEEAVSMRALQKDE